MNDPWRYACISCMSVNVRRVTPKAYSKNKGDQRFRDGRYFKCRHPKCAAANPFAWDKKRSVAVGPELSPRTDVKLELYHNGRTN